MRDGNKRKLRYADDKQLRTSETYDEDVENCQSNEPCVQPAAKKKRQEGEVQLRVSGWSSLNQDIIETLVNVSRANDELDEIGHILRGLNRHWAQQLSIHVREIAPSKCRGACPCDVLEAVIRDRRFPNVEKVDVTNCKQRQKKAQQDLSGTFDLPSLNTLWCKGACITPDTLMTLDGNVFLTSLKLMDTGVQGSMDLKREWNMPKLPNLACFEVSSNSYKCPTIDLSPLSGSRGLTHFGLDALWINNESTVVVEEFTNLRSLCLAPMGGVKDREFASFLELTTLTELELSCIGVNYMDHRVGEIAVTLTALRRVKLSSCESLTDNGVRHLSALEHLEDLGLGGSRNISARRIATLTNLRKLEVIDLGSLGRWGLYGLTALEHLTALNISHPSVLPRHAMHFVKKMMNLVELKLFGPFTKTLPSLSRNLVKLSMGSDVEGRALRCIPTLTKLTSLEFRTAQNVDNYMVEKLSTLVELRELRLLWCTNVKLQSLFALTPLTGLTKITIEPWHVYLERGEIAMVQNVMPKWRLNSATS